MGLLESYPLVCPKERCNREQSVTNVTVDGDLASSIHHLEMHGGSCLNIDQIIYFLKDLRIRRYVDNKPMPFAKRELIFVQRIISIKSSSFLNILDFYTFNSAQ